MESRIVSGKLLVGTPATHVECGFIPDSLQLLRDLAGTIKHYKWMKVLYDYAPNSLGKYGFDIDGVPTVLGAAAENANDGFMPYDASVETVLLPAPDGHGFWKAASIADFNVATVYVARTGAALGTVLRPTVHNGFVYECVASSGGASPEPLVWGTVLGGITTDLVGTDQWICRTERIVRRGVKGFTIGSAICTDGQYWAFEAKKHDRYSYMGDADAENPVTFAEHDH